MSQKKKKRFIYITAQDILGFHEMLIKRHGGIQGNYENSYGRAESIVSQQYYAH